MPPTLRRTPTSTRSATARISRNCSRNWPRSRSCSLRLRSVGGVESVDSRSPKSLVGAQYQARLRALLVRPDLQAEVVEVDVFAFFVHALGAAVQAQANEAPQAGAVAGVVVAAEIDVGLQQPPPNAAFSARFGLFLPPLQNARDGLQRRAPGFCVGNGGPDLVGFLFDFHR